MLCKVKKNQNLYILSFCFSVSSGDPYVHHLAGKCKWTLRLPGDRSSDVVALSSHTDADKLVEQICQDLGCGGVYHLNITSSPPNTTCFHDCLYKDDRLQNCSQSEGSNCAVIIEAVCGKVVSNMSLFLQYSTAELVRLDKMTKRRRCEMFDHAYSE